MDRLTGREEDDVKHHAECRGVVHGHPAFKGDRGRCQAERNTAAFKGKARDRFSQA